MPLITTPFDLHTTADEAAAGIDLAGRRAIVTGASSGIGLETARVLAAAGAEVTLAVRDLHAGARAAAAISSAAHGAAVHVARLDLADQGSVAAFAADWSGPLHVLVNNGGVMAVPDLVRTREGWELQFATNHLGHFALTLALQRALAVADDARVVSLSSLAHHGSPIVFDDVHFTSRPYSPRAAYAQSKTANVLFAVEATRRWQADGITVNAVDPGRVPGTALLRHIDPVVVERLTAGRELPPAKTAAQGAATSIVVATSPLLAGVGGRYFENGNEAEVVHPDPAKPLLGGVADFAVDTDNAGRLWRESEAALAGRT